MSVKILDPLLMIPYIIPGTVLGIGFIVAFNAPPIYLAGYRGHRHPHVFHPASSVFGSLRRVHSQADRPLP